MANFIFLYRATPEANQQHMGTPEAARASMQAFTTWVAELERKGHLVDPGQPLDRRGAVVKGKDLITDGPFTELKDIVLGFSLIRADNLKQATVLAESCPVLQGEASVEVRPIAEVNF
ncbi:MAG: YciI family protein [Polyangiaceae bacterium]